MNGSVGLLDGLDACRLHTTKYGNDFRMHICSGAKCIISIDEMQSGS